MKLAAHLAAGPLGRRFARLQGEIENAALDAASDALAAEMTAARGREALHAPLLRSADARRRLVGAGDADSVTRELGSPSEPPAPWLAPVLPAARAPMRAAVLRAVARALSRSRSPR